MTVPGDNPESPALHRVGLFMSGKQAAKPAPALLRNWGGFNFLRPVGEQGRELLGGGAAFRFRLVQPLPEIGNLILRLPSFPLPLFPQDLKLALQDPVRTVQFKG